jgi:uroporphyrinogen-III decarboxylase
MAETKNPFDFDASARRIWAAYRSEPADRVPLMPPISWTANGDIDSHRFGDWRDEEGFRSVARLVQRHCDVRPPFNNNVPRPSVFESTGYMRFLEAAPEYVESLPPERILPHRVRQTTLLHTPKGDLRWVYEADDGIFTQWDMEKPIRTPQDVEKLLSVPYRFAPPEPAQYDAYRQRRAEKGRYWLGGEGVNSMVAMLCGMMDFELLLEWVLTEPTLIRMLADEWLRRVGEKVAFLQSQGVGPFWHFNGVERASPPMMGPRQWEEWVVPYDGELMRRIKRADPAARIHVHCHGRVGTLLDSFLAMGVDSTDPVEPPNQGDIEFAEAKRRCAGRMTLYGNIEFVDMERCTPDEIELRVRRAIEDGGKARMVLMPSAGPHSRPTARFIANATRYIEAGVKYGVLG